MSDMQRPTTKDEAARYESALEGDNLADFTLIREAYRRVRANVGSAEKVTTRLWQKEFGGRMAKIIAHSAAAILLEEGEVETFEAVRGILPKPITDALTVLTKVVEQELHVIGQQEHKRFQDLILKERVASGTQLANAKERVTDLQAAGHEVAHENLDGGAIREELAICKDERNAAIEKLSTLLTQNADLQAALRNANEERGALQERLVAEQAAHKRQLDDVRHAHIADCAQLESANARVMDLATQNESLKEQVVTIEHDLLLAVSDASRASTAEAECTALREQVVVLVEEKAKRSDLVAEIDQRREREAAAMRVDHEAHLADLRQQIADLRRREHGNAIVFEGSHNG